MEKDLQWACKTAEEFTYLFGTHLHCFYSNSNRKYVDTGTCKAVKEADSYPSLHKLPSKMQMATHTPQDRVTVSGVFRTSLNGALQVSVFPRPCFH